jgi:hypothetical protein
MAIKRPTINKPGIVKPSINKKAPVAPTKIVKEEVEEVVQETIQEVVEETIEENEIEVPVDIIVKEESVIEETQEEVVVQETVQEEIVQEQVAEEVVAEEQIVEEQVEEQVEEVVEVKEEPKKKSNSRKRSSAKKAKEEVVEEKSEAISKEDYKAKPLVDAMKEMIGITGCTTPDWEATKAEIMEQVQGMQIDPDSTPAEMRYLIADIDAALSQLKILKINADQQFNPLLKHINYVSLQAGSKGSNSEERKANAIRGLIEYKSNPDDAEYTNLLDIQVFAENQIAFYDEMIKILQDKKNMLITFSGIVKTETQLGGY